MHIDALLSPKYNIPISGYFMPPLPVTAAQALLTSIANNGRQLIDPRDDFLFDPAGFIADPNPPFITSRPAKAIARAACRSWARQEGDSTNPAADRLYSEVCGPYLDSIGEGVEGGSIGPPFQGGQCPEVYLVTLERLNADGVGLGPFIRRARGPIVGVRRIVANPATPTVFTLQIGSNGFNPSATTCGALADSGFAWRTIGTGTNQDIRINSVEICAGSDTCGNPQPEYERPRPPIVLPPITPIFIDLPDIGPVEVNVNVDAEGLINVESPTLNVEVNLPAPGTPDPTDSGGDGGGVVPPPGTPGPQADTGDGGTAEGQAPDGQELVGVQVEILEFPIGANRFQNNLAEPFRGIGYVRMGYPNRLAVDVSAGVVISPQFFLAPVRGLTNWEVRANVGFINRVTPFYRELPT